MSERDLEEIRGLFVKILQNQAIIVEQIMWLNQQPKAKEEHHLTTPPSAISSGIKRKMWLPLEEDEERMKFTGFIRKVQLGDGVVDNDGEPPGCKRVKKADGKDDSLWSYGADDWLQIIGSTAVIGGLLDFAGLPAILASAFI